MLILAKLSLVNEFGKLSLAPPYTAILMGVSNTVGAIPGMLSPAVTGIIVKDRTMEEWQTVFLITAAVYFFGCVAVRSLGQRGQAGLGGGRQHRPAPGQGPGH